MKFQTTARVLKVDGELGLVMGYAIICKDQGEPYFDTQGDHIPEESMLEAALDFMESSRVSREGHQGGQTGEVLFAWPMTEEIAKAYEIEIPRTGLMIAIRPDAQMLAKFKSGDLTGFSIGGQRIEDEEVADAA